MAATTPMLEVRGLHAYYGKSHILHGVDLHVGEGEIVALLGRNGVGRSTLAKSIMGMVRCEGHILLRGKDVRGLRTFEVAHRGIGYVPENRDIFPTLTVRQNLLLGRSATRASRGRAGSSTTCTACSLASRSVSTRRPACSPAASSRC